MNSLLKYLLLLVLLTGFGKFGFAQDSSKAETTGEIVMTKTQLQSFLSTIAKLKKQHIAQQDSARQQQMELKLKRYNKSYAQEDAQTRDNFSEPESGRYGNQEFSNPMKQYNSSYEERLFTQLQLINARLNSLMSEIELLKIKMALNDGNSYSQVAPSGRSNQQLPQIHLAPKSQPVIINQGAPSQQPNLDPGLQRNLALGIKNKRDKEQSLPDVQSNDSALLARQREQLLLKNRIGGLENKMSLLQGLLKGSDEGEKNKYNAEISKLNEQIDALKAQVARNNKDTDSLKIKKQNSLMNLLTNFSYKIYFKNNSTQIPSSDYSKLQEIVNIAQKNPQVSVVLRGFASKAGDPNYNDKISYQRAVSVKKWLLNNGLDSKEIVTKQRGVDRSVDAARARRVEITFKVE